MFPTIGFAQGYKADQQRALSGEEQGRDIRPGSKRYGASKIRLPRDNWPPYFLARGNPVMLLIGAEFRAGDHFMRCLEWRSFCVSFIQRAFFYRRALIVTVAVLKKL